MKTVTVRIEQKDNRYRFAVRLAGIGKPIVSGNAATAETVGKRVAEAVAILLPRKV